MFLYFRESFNFIFSYVHECVSVCTWMQDLQRQDEGPSSSEAGVTGGCELPNMGAGNRTQVLCKSSVRSKLLSHIPSLDFFVF